MSAEVLKILPEYVSSGVLAIIFIIFLLSRLFPEFRRRLFNNSVTRRDWELLFNRYDQLVRDIQKESQASMANVKMLFDRVDEQLKRFDNIFDHVIKYIETSSVNMQQQNQKNEGFTQKLDEIIKYLIELKTKINARRR